MFATLNTEQCRWTRGIEPLFLSRERAARRRLILEKGGKWHLSCWQRKQIFGDLIPGSPRSQLAQSI